MKVKAIMRGHYGQIRDEGDEFEIGSEGEFSSRWMEKVEDAKPEPKVKAKAKVKAKEED